MITKEEPGSVITDLQDINRRYVVRDGFIFTSVDASGAYDGILIRCPEYADCGSPLLGFSERSLEEHIRAINEYGITKALVMAENIDFLPKCPSLEVLKICPAYTAGNGFDYSPLYKMPKIRHLNAQTEYINKQNNQTEHYSTAIDYSKINGLEFLQVSGKGHFNFQKIPTLKELCIGAASVDTLEALDLPELTQLSVIKCGVENLRGIENSPKLERLKLWYMKKLADISALGALPHIRSLNIENCPKIGDFRVISQLKELEYLTLEGKNELVNLDFIVGLDKLKYMALTMNVLDGNIEPLKKLKYVYAVCKRHYNLKAKDLPRDKEGVDFSMI